MKKLPLAIASLGLAALSLAACGGTFSVAPTGSSGAGGSSGNGASSASTGAAPTGSSSAGSTSTGAGGESVGVASSTSSSGGAGAPCPSMEPTSGEPCGVASAGVRCTYGDSVAANCRDVWTCTSGAWSGMKASCPPPTAVCPTEPAPNEPCTGMGVECVYDPASVCYCGCGGGACSLPYHWQCSGPPTTPGCPPTVPNDGTACSQDKLECTYGAPCTPTNAIVDCTDGYWKWEMGAVCN
jgi:hypothetical protein